MRPIKSPGKACIELNRNSRIKLRALGLPPNIIGVKVVLHLANISRVLSIPSMVVGAHGS